MTPAWVKEAVVGATLATVEKDGVWWSFKFTSDSIILTDSFWRVRASSGIPVTGEDDGQLFGLSEPVNAAARAQSHLRGQVTDIEATPETADLIVRFENGATLEVFNTSCAFESWQLRVGADVMLIGLGGGRVATTRREGREWITTVEPEANSKKKPATQAGAAGE